MNLKLEIGILATAVVVVTVFSGASSAFIYFQF